ncbi:MAG: hypothetical protein ABMB14_37220 [Myxococcota bacterium]
MVRSSVVVAGLLATSCVTSLPYDGTVVGYTDNPFLIAGYADTPNTWIAVEVYDAPGWTELARVQTAPTPTYAAGVWSYNSPALYYYRMGSVRIFYGYWVAVDPYAWPYSWHRATLRVRNTQTGDLLYSGRSDSLACFLETISPTTDFITATVGCGFSSAEIDVYADVFVQEWPYP